MFTIPTTWRTAIFAAIIMLASCKAASDIYLVRHGEKISPSGDVALSGDGLQRAETLKDSLRLKKITHVYSTNYKRTRQTAAPTAIHFGRDIAVYANGDSLMQVLLNRKNARSLVVGHSNNIPAMIRNAGLPLSFSGDMPDRQYDNLFIIRVRWNGKRTMTLQETKYGMPSN